MSAIHVYLKKNSVCGCGFPLLDTRIAVGKQTDYYAGPRTVVFDFICGGCGKKQSLPCWFIHEKEWPWGKSKAGFLPSEVFERLEQRR